MFLIGLTGGIASGKSTVAKIFEENGFPVVDADFLARKVVEPNKKAWRKLKEEFGGDIMQEDGTLNREKLAEVIFNDRFRRKRLNEITHPQIIKEIIYSVIKLALNGHKCAILDIPLLYESGELIRFMHKVVVVNCRADQQIERLLSRTKMDENQARLRVTSQMPLEKKCTLADYVIDNGQSLEETERQTINIIEDLHRSKFHYKLRAYLFIGVFLGVLSGFAIIKTLLS